MSKNGMVLFACSTLFTDVTYVNLEIKSFLLKIRIKTGNSQYCYYVHASHTVNIFFKHVFFGRGAWHYVLRLSTTPASVDG